ncbi:MAG: hypothetical protein IPH34_04335 [Chitinophagaceae bacterium]|nr:hypothetical protein [Chitinophagaceae bacterium]
MKVNGKAVIDIVLSTSKKELQEVIVTAQGQAAQKEHLAILQSLITAVG